MMSALPSPVLHPLARRETEVLRLLAQGLHNREISVAMGITENTVKVHIYNVYSKIGVSNRVEAAAWYSTHFGDPR